jgi:hypothetical protein
MARLESLFQNHLADLKDIVPSTKDTFICPICLSKYSFDDIKNKKLSRGDVWAKYIRDISNDKTLKNQIVLLCKDCNSQAGRYGDSQMQLFEQVKDGDNTGNLYGMRPIKLKAVGDDPVFINANISIDSDTKRITISGKFDKDSKWLNNDPKMQQRFMELVGKKEPISIAVDAKLLGERKPKPELAPVGWITSAYLFAFYTFGYRYILHPSLNLVRAYISSSFDETNHMDLKTTPSVFDLREYKDKYFSSPEIELIVPLENTESVYLQINILRYQINLRFHYVPSVLSSLIYSRMPDFQQQLPELQKQGSILFFQIKQVKIGGVDSLWDYLLGKPIPLETRI